MRRHYSITYTQSLHAINGLLAVGRVGNLLCGRLSYYKRNSTTKFQNEVLGKHETILHCRFIFGFCGSNYKLKIFSQGKMHARTHARTHTHTHTLLYKNTSKIYLLTTCCIQYLFYVNIIVLKCSVHLYLDLYNVFNIVYFVIIFLYWSLLFFRIFYY